METVIDIFQAIGEYFWQVLIIIGVILLFVVKASREAIGKVVSYIVDNLIKKHSKKYKYNEEIYVYIRDDIKVDRKLLDYIYNNDFIAPFNFDNINYLHDFNCEYSSGLIKEATDKKMKILLDDLFSKSQDFIIYLSVNTFPAKGNTYYNRVPGEWQHEQKERYIETTKRILELRTEIYNSLSNYLTYVEKKY